jgi:hypothetical protein
MRERNPVDQPVAAIEAEPEAEPVSQPVEPVADSAPVERTVEFRQFGEQPDRIRNS